MEKIKKKEIKRIRHILDEIVSIAEDDELGDGLISAVRRYNSIIRHLESTEVLPPGLFQLLSEGEGSINFHQVAVESRMLSGYLEEIVDEEEEASGKPDFGPVIALAPFLDQSDLKALVHSHLSGRGFAQRDQEKQSARPGPPDLRALAGLAPHLSQRDLAEMVEACLAREPLSDPHLLLALAPHLDSKDLGRLLRHYVPGWFDRAGPASEGPPASFRSDPPVDPPPAFQQHPFGDPEPGEA